MGLVDELRGLPHLLLIVGGDGADELGSLVFKFADRGGDVLGDVHQHGAFAAALGDAEGGAHGVGQVLHVAHREIVLGDGHGDALDVGLLEGIPAQLGGGHVAGESHHGHAVHVGGGDAGDQIGGAGAAGGQHHAGAAGGPGVAVRRVAGALLVGGEDVAHTVGIAVQLIVQIQHGAAGIAEDGVHPLLHQHLHENLRASEFHSLSPFPLHTKKQPLSPVPQETKAVKRSAVPL